MDERSTFTWTDDFLLGYSPLDATHREFVEVVGALIAAPDDALAAHLDAFARHAESHFELERRLMADTAFPAADCHNDEHAAVMKSVREVQAIVAAGDLTPVRSLARALADWFPGHADYLDSALAAWVSKQRFGGKPVVLKRDMRRTAPALGSRD
jgi:hemerythrin